MHTSRPSSSNSVMVPTLLALYPLYVGLNGNTRTLSPISIVAIF